MGAWPVVHEYRYEILFVGHIQIPLVKKSVQARVFMSRLVLTIETIIPFSFFFFFLDFFHPTRFNFK